MNFLATVALALAPMIAPESTVSTPAHLTEYGVLVGVLLLVVKIMERLIDKVPGLKDSGAVRLQESCQQMADGIEQLGLALRDHQQRADQGFQAMGQAMQRLEDQVTNRVTGIAPILQELAKVAAVQSTLLTQIVESAQKTSSAIITLTALLERRD